MEENIIKRVSNQKPINLNELNIEALYRLHFEEETYAANLLKQMPPFSKERYSFLNKSYEVIEKIKKYRYLLEEKNHVRSGYDKEKYFLYTIFVAIKKRMKKKRKLIVLELGCGEGKFLKKISHFQDIVLYGCDLHPNVNLNNQKITIYKDTIFNTLNKFQDGTIDILIADNVCEHFFKDEIDSIYTLINRKLNKKGKIIFIIPNSNIGPSDISKKFLSMGEKAVGFHFMEQTYKENIKMFRKYGFTTNYLCMRKLYLGKKQKQPFFIYNFMNMPDKVKIFMEKYFAKLNEKKRKHVFLRFGYHIYILKK